MNKIFENIYNSNNKSHLKENDFFVGASGQIQHEIEPDAEKVNEIPEFVKQFFGFDNGPQIIAAYSDDMHGNEAAIEINYDIPHGDEACACGENECDCTRTNVEYKRADEVSSYPDDSCVGEWLDLNNLRDESPLASVISLISTNFNRNAHTESGTNCDTVLTVDNLTDNKEIRELIDVISGTLTSGGFGIEGYRLHDGNLQLKIGK